MPLSPGRALALLSLAAVSGCWSANARVAAPAINAETVSAALLKEYDADHDDILVAAEIKNFPAVQGALPFYDQDNNGAVTRDELKSRLKEIVGAQVGLMSFFCKVTWNGEPLPGAKVELTPEPSLASVLKPAVGVTNVKGTAQVAIPDELLPANERGLSMMQPGLYRVRITHPDKPIPEQYNAQTKLGQETSGDSLVGKNVVYELREGGSP